MLNEINKQEVYNYIYNWIDQRLLNGNDKIEILKQIFPKNYSCCCFQNKTSRDD